MASATHVSVAGPFDGIPHQTTIAHHFTRDGPILCVASQIAQFRDDFGGRIPSALYLSIVFGEENSEVAI